MSTMMRDCGLEIFLGGTHSTLVRSLAVRHVFQQAADRRPTAVEEADVSVCPVRRQPDFLGLEIDLSRAAEVPVPSMLGW